MAESLSYPAIEATPKDMEPLAAPGTKPTIHHVYEDQFRSGKWTTRFPERLAPPVEDAESAQHALVVRYKLSDKPDKNLDLHSIVVQSPYLKKLLGRVFDGYPGITVELERLEFNAPFDSFVHRWERLNAVRDELLQQPKEGVEEMEHSVTHLELLYAVLTDELAGNLREKQDLLNHGVMKFDKVWTIFEPGCLIYRRHDEHGRVYKLKQAKYDSNNSTRVYKLECQYVDFDGTEFGMNKETLYVTAFPGTKKIAKFEAYPLSFHENADQVRQSLIQRGRAFEAYKGYHFVAYEGIAWGKAHRGEAKYNVNSRIIIDAHAYARYQNKVTLEYFETASDVQEASSSQGGHEDDTDDDCVILDKDVASKKSPDVGKKPIVTDESRSVLTDEQLLLADSKVRGYSLRDKKWFNFSIDNIKDIEWNDSAFQSLVAPREQKDLILAFAESQIKHRERFDDFIQGKGKGIIMLLSGPPGVGKTLTAESVAEAMKAPLYSIGAADLGSKPGALEKSLADILEMCAKWNAVLLLDEADVFMEARSTADLDRNKLVSIFLRLLEYFEGIMFLTTNRIENMDAAFESRIHLSLQYHELDKASRRQIWSTFLLRSSETRNSNVGAFTDAELDRLAKVPLNGRQIKNVLKTAQLLASKYDECLGMGHLETVLKLRKANEKRTVSFLSGE